MTNEDRIVEIGKKLAESNPAFPIPLEASTLGVVQGLSKREYFACKAMQGFTANSDITVSPKEYSEAAVTLADALIDALAKTKEEKCLQHKT